MSGPADGGTFTLSIGSRCVKGVKLRVRSNGAFRDAGSSDALDLKEVTGGALQIIASAPAPVEAFEVVLPAIPGDTILQQGYQSWGYSGVAKIPASVPLAADGAPQLVAAQEGSPLGETAGVSYGSAVVGAPGGPYFVAGALSAARATTGIAATSGASGSGADVTILHGATRETLPADADGKVRSEPVYLAFANQAAEGLSGLAAQMAAALPGGPRAPAVPPGGWFSWNEHFAKIDEKLIQANADVVADKFAPPGMKLVEIDDGWEIAWGDWQAGPSFSSGMDKIGSYITGKGLVAGVWLAPFLVDVTSAAAKSADPSLFVQGPDKKPLVHKPSGNPRQFYVLDGTSDASMAIATDAIKALRAAGFRYFKLDFLYAGALPGGHHTAGSTGNQALAQGLEKLRAAAGSDAIIDACGAPIVPVLGWADALRVGTDTAFDAISLKWPLVVYAARSLAARAYLAPLVWPDADQAQLRAPYTADEAKVAAAVSALAGPAYGLGDDLTTLDPARLSMALDPALIDIAAAPRPASPGDLFAAAAPDTVPTTPVLDFLGCQSLGAPARDVHGAGKERSALHHHVLLERAARGHDREDAVSALFIGTSRS